MYKCLFISFLLCFMSVVVNATSTEQKMTAKQYIEKYKNEAIAEMLNYNIPASITLAQGMLESGNGNSDLAVYANNHFGIKCHKEWSGPTFTKDDDKKNECFRKYSTVLDSYNDHSNFLNSRSRYASLFELNRTDYMGWARGLKEAGYATDPKYAHRLVELIENYSLDQYDYPPAAKTESANKNDSHKKHEQHKIIEPEKKQETEVREMRNILRFRSINYIIIKPNDTFKKIALDTDKDLWQLYKFNDLEAGATLIAGQKLYLQPKRNKAKEPFHILKKGETMKSISQLHGIKLKQLYKKNNLKTGEEPKVGDELYMRAQKPTTENK